MSILVYELKQLIICQLIIKIFNALTPTEEGDKNLLEYIQYTRISGKWSGSIEFIVSNIIYNFNLYVLYDITDKFKNSIL